MVNEEFVSLLACQPLEEALVLFRDGAGGEVPHGVGASAAESAGRIYLPIPP